MEETTAPRFGPRGILVALGVAFVVAALWAATALASGGSSGPSGSVATPPGDGAPSAFVESPPDAAAAPSREDCPGHGGGSGGDSAPSGGSSSSADAL